MTTIPVIQLELTETQRKAFSIADNKTGEIADWDYPKLREVLDELRKEDIELKSLGLSSDEIRRLILSEDRDEDYIPQTNTESTTKLVIFLLWADTDYFAVIQERRNWLKH